jgi:predicted peptidase
MPFLGGRVKSKAVRHNLMKSVILIFLILCLVNITLLCQSQNGSEQIIQRTIGQDIITVQVLDFHTDYPLIGASVYSRDLNDTISSTDINGMVTFEKSISQNFRISYIGYENFCFRIKDNTIDNVTVRLKMYIPLNIGFQVYSPFVDSLQKTGKSDAENDLEEDIVQLLCETTPTEDQKVFAQKYSFMFSDGKDKTIDYRGSYNKVVLDFLSDKYDVNIRKELDDICWINN